jgi:hypothetical protein
MNENLEVGQILWLKVKYQVGIISNQKHPMLIEKIKDDYIEVIALDKTKDKLYQLFHNYNYYINCESPKEKVILEDSYAQLNTKLTIENGEQLKKARKTVEKLSKNKLKDLLTEYNRYQNNNKISIERIVHMKIGEILELNPELKD